MISSSCLGGGSGREKEAVLSSEALNLLKRVLWHENYAALTSLAAVLGQVCVFGLQSNDDPFAIPYDLLQGCPWFDLHDEDVGKDGL